jgi:hypothetical protein
MIVAIDRLNICFMIAALVLLIINQKLVFTKHVAVVSPSSLIELSLIYLLLFYPTK